MIKIICVGKIKEHYLEEGINDYLKRISKYHKIEIVEIPDNDPLTEGKAIINHLGKNDYVISLCIEGEIISSMELANKLDKTFITNPCITFIIGGSNGLSDEVKNISKYRLSFSRMTYPHGLFRLILLEQIYRCFKINNHETYHK